MAYLRHCSDRYLLWNLHFFFFSILGSGGAIIGLLQDESKFEEMRDELQRFMGSVVVDVIPNEF